MIRGAGDDLGTGADLPEFMEARAVRGRPAARGVRLEGRRRHATRRSATSATARTTTAVVRQPAGGCRSLQEFKKISIVEVKGYCYGWHFYQAGDADLVISSDDALFGHPAFRYVGYGPRMWWWAHDDGAAQVPGDGLHRPAVHRREMYECNFVNSVVPRDQLEAEVAEVRAGLRAEPARPTPSSCRRSSSRS